MNIDKQQQPKTSKIKSRNQRGKQIIKLTY